MLAGQIAIVIAALFTGAAFYVGFAEHPARMTLADAPLLAQWKPAYKRGFAMQAALAVAGFLAGIAAWWQTQDWPWLVGALVLIANWPFTLIVMMPTNKRLMAAEPGEAGAATRGELVRWERLHRVRTALGAAATLTFVLASLA